MGFKKRQIATSAIDSSNAGAPIGRSLGMSLADLAALTSAQLLGTGDESLEISGVRDDSRHVRKGELFVAVKGMSVDGHNYADAAIKNGAAALVVERKLKTDLPQLLVACSSRALGILAAHAAGRPADSITTIGITGTNGKTTTSYLIEAVLEAAGKKPGVLGTVSYRWMGKEKAAPYTTPTPLVLQDAFTKMKAEGCDTALLEVSSAALHMDRLVGTQFDVAAFSNLSQDHLDIHKTMHEYRDAKARLFGEQMAPQGVAVINIDDEAGAFMAEAAGAARVLRVSRRADADAEIRVLSFTSSIGGIKTEIATPTGKLKISSEALIGHYNVDNIALAVGIGEALGFAHDVIAKGISEMRGVPGRVERVANSAGLNILVDYAHTPDALVNVLAALKPLTKARLLCVFGCGGDRDPDKRPQMGAAVADAADLAFITSDNPRTEDPQSILDMITSSVPNAFFADVDRRVAIAAAVAEATPSDVALIAGKGHEDYQILGTEKVHFDDREEAAAACKARKSFSKDSILLETGGTCIAEEPCSEFSRVIIDGRSAAPGDLYVAIRGENFDGHDFCQQALDAGATGLLLEKGRGKGFSGATVIEVDDPREALGHIARKHRQDWGGKVIGITGSAGKTTTKDLLATALRGAGRVHAAAGSNNNETGVPLTLLGIRPHHDFAVIEMGMRGLGEIDYLANIALPDVAVVTNAGTAHVGRLGSPAAIARAKGEIYERHTGGGIGIYPEDDPRLGDLARACDTRKSFGDSTGETTSDADLCLASYQPQGAGGCTIEVEYEEETLKIDLALVGKHNAINACAALLAAISAGASLESAAESMARVKAPPMRGEIREIAGRKVLVDCYNANPTSMEAALRTLEELRSGRQAFAVLGDMLELGEQSAAAHERVGEHVAGLRIPVVAMGEFRTSIVAGAAGSGGEAWSAADPLAAARAALACTEPGDWILLKASRGMELERVADSMHTESQTGESR
ncbi:MAG: UDP-N-acetylmuramoyl-L-alanyl-D-glutamate--2,6-diaminopimelate ligase [Myxococcales bacterium]|nr:UDP-N-acetylmuramoyl-L-alanyl-D-glutamate--2,6-diaminopimelate ligase [Myxococcales bacterium]